MSYICLLTETKGKKLNWFCLFLFRTHKILYLQNENDQIVSVVATVEKFYDIIEHVHSTENKHVDYKKILTEVWKYSELRML